MKPSILPVRVSILPPDVPEAPLILGQTSIIPPHEPEAPLSLGQTLIPLSYIYEIPSPLDYSSSLNQD